MFTFVYKPFLVPSPKKLGLNRLLHSGICEKQTSGSVPFVRGGGKPQAQVGTVLSASACDPRERTSPHHLIHQLTARTTAAFGDLLLSNCHRSQQQAGHMGGSHTNCSHTATPPSPPPPPPFANRTPQLGGKNSTFRWTFWRKHSPTSLPCTLTFLYKCDYKPPIFKICDKLGHINPNLLLPVCALVCPEMQAK